MGTNVQCLNCWIYAQGNQSVSTQVVWYTSSQVYKLQVFLRTLYMPYCNVSLRVCQSRCFVNHIKSWYTWVWCHYCLSNIFEVSYYVAVLLRLLAFCRSCYTLLLDLIDQGDKLLYINLCFDICISFAFTYSYRYQSCLLGSFQTVELIETFMNYQVWQKETTYIFLLLRKISLHFSVPIFRKYFLGESRLFHQHFFKLSFHHANVRGIIW
jgi:hypothetical protein